jgi:hypothetical protein
VRRNGQPKPRRHCARRSTTRSTRHATCNAARATRNAALTVACATQRSPSRAQRSSLPVRSARCRTARSVPHGDAGSACAVRRSRLPQARVATCCIGLQRVVADCIGLHRVATLAGPGVGRMRDTARHRVQGAARAPALARTRRARVRVLAAGACHRCRVLTRTAIHVWPHLRRDWSAACWRTAGHSYKLGRYGLQRLSKPEAFWPELDLTDLPSHPQPQTPCSS